MAQAGQKVIAAYKVQSGLGTAASGAGGTGIRILEGAAGLEFARTVIDNTESRSDGQSTKGRLGSGRSSGSFDQNLSLGTQNDWIEALFRGTFVAETTLTQASGSLTSISTPTTSTILNGGGSWITSGVRKGDKIKLTGFNTTANNGKWFRVVNVSAGTITVAGTPLVVDAAADTTFSLIIAKTVLMGTTERYYTVDQHDSDNDVTELFTDVKICKLDLTAGPDANVKVSFTLQGLAGTEQVSGSSPILTGPVYTTTLPLVFSDGTVRINGTDYTVITSLNLSIDCGGSAPATNALNPPDVFLDNAKVSGSFSCHKLDSAFFAAARAETTVDLFFDFVQGTDADPKGFVSFYIGNATLAKASGSMGATGPRVVTVPFFAGKDEAGTANAATMVKFSSSV